MALDPTDIIFLLVGITMVSAVWVLLGRGGSYQLKRLGRYILIASKQTEGKKGKPNLYQAIDQKLDRVPVIKTLFNYIERHLTMANIPVKTSEFLIAVLVLMVTALVVQILLTGGVHYLSPLVLAGALLFSFGLLKLYIAIRIGNVRKQLKLAISLLSNNLKAGHSFIQAMRQVTADLTDPLKSEFELLLNENRLGIPLDVALNNMLKRVPCKELQTLVRGVILQQQTGSNLIYILNTIYQTLQDRDELRSRINVLTVQGKLSGVVCVSIPFLLFLYMHKSQPDYTEILLKTQTGNYMLMTCGIMILIGSVIIVRIVRFKF